MKISIRLAVLLLFIVPPTLVFSQLQDDWAPIGATWYYSEEFAFSGDQSFAMVTSIGDTIIDGKNCRILEKTKTIGCNLRPYKEYFHLNNSSELFFYDEQFDGFQKLFDFEAKAGDSWNIYLSTELEADITDTVVYVIDSISQVQINGRMLREFHYRQEFTGPYYEGPSTARYIEVIGPTVYFFPWYIGYCDGNMIGGLRCYEDSEFGHYETGIVDSCDYTYEWLGVKTNNFTNTTVYPNPASFFLTIEFDNPEFVNGQLIIYDNLGRVVNIVEDIFDSKIDLDVRQYEPGIYYFRLLNEEENQESRGKFLVE